MDIYVLDRGFRYSEIIDKFTSVVWTERYDDAGDLTLVVPDSRAMRDLIPDGTFIGCTNSNEVMMIESRSVENGLITYIGTSLSGYLKQKMLRSTWSTSVKSWELTGAPGWIAGEIVRQMCTAAGKIADGTVISTAAGQYEWIPNLVIGPVAAGTSQAVAVEFGNVFDGVKKACELDDLGFTLYPTNITESSYSLVFTTYAGRNLTSSQSTFPVVRFDSALDSLTETKEFRSIAEYKTVAYAWAPNIPSSLYIVGVAYAYSGAEFLTGFDRRSLQVLCDDINPNDPSTDSGAALRALLTQRAKNAIANNNYVKMADGKIVPQPGAVYGSDYTMGDIVELRTKHGLSSTARVIEFIQTQDKSGYSAYPTLSVIS